MNTLPLVLVIVGVVAEAVLVLPAKSDVANSFSRDPANECPPGVWTCQLKRQLDLIERGKLGSDVANSVSRDPANECPPGVWTCQLKRQLDLIEREKAGAQEDAGNLCPPGVWTCRKREIEAAKRLAEVSQDATLNDDSDERQPKQRQDLIEREKAAAQEDAGNLCPPGVWTCRKKREIEAAKRLAEVSQDATLNDDSDESKCPPGIWVCEKKRMLKQMKHMQQRAMEAVKQRLFAVKRTNKCPPGIWVCE